MKRHWFIICLIVLSMLALVACDDSLSSLNSDGQDGDDTTPVVQNEDTLAVYTNIANDGTVISRGLGNQVAMPEVHGVLLKYHNEGLYSYNSSYFKNEFNQSTGTFKHKDAFYLEYLGSDEETWYGMTFNYVLYVPNIIQETYEEGDGKNPDSGNPFWWYMSTYYGQSMNTIRDNWPDTVALLQKHKVNGVRKPHKEDVRGTWSQSYSNYFSTYANETNGYGVKFRNVDLYYYDEGLGTYVYVNTILYTGSPVPKTMGGEALYQLFIPEELYYAYAAGSGNHTSLNAFLWYFEKYHNKSAEELATAFREDRLGDLIEECFSERPYQNPSAYDVDSVSKTITVQGSYSGEPLELGMSYYYIPGTLELEDGTTIDDGERIYIQVKNNILTVYVPEAYIAQMKAEHERRGIEFDFSGDFIWRYFSWHGLVREGAGFYLTEADIAKLLEYRSSVGLF